MRLFAAVLVICGCLTPASAALPPVQTVFVIVLENLAWPKVEGNPSAPYINGTLLPMASFCRQYYNPPGLHPSLPDYIWMEAGTNFGIWDDADPLYHHIDSTNHLTTLLRNAGISWRAYQEDISGLEVPLTMTNLYTPRHNPFVYFDDVTGTNDPQYPYALEHIRPFSEMAADLTNNTVARYNFISPNLCNDMHDPCPPLTNALLQADTWLSNQVPQILASAAYTNNGALFIVWDEGDFTDGPIGMILLSPLERAPGYASYVAYDHSSFLRTLQEIFGVTPLLGAAVNANSMIDLFAGLRLGTPQWLTNGDVQLEVNGALSGVAHVLQGSEDLLTWTGLCTNVPTTNRYSVVVEPGTNWPSRFYRLLQTP